MTPRPSAPLVGVSNNPIVGMRQSDMRFVVPGSPVRDLAPVSNSPVVCRLNGEWLLRAYWDELVIEGDVLEFYEVPQSRGVIRAAIVVAAVAAAFYTGGASLSLLQYAAVASIAYTVANILVPPRLPTQNTPGAANGVFGTSLAGNAARLDQPIWKVCGRVKTTPPFACSSYVEYLAHDPSNPTVDCDQYYYALFALGVGDHDLEKAFIGKTAMAHFQDVLISNYLPPGTQPTQVRANVVNSGEVQAALDLEPLSFVGGFAACRPGDTCSEIAVDVTASQGLGTSDGSALTVKWRVQVREIDDYGAPVGNWVTIADESRTATTNTPQRWSNHYTLSTAMRPEVRVGRTNSRNSDSGARDGIAWIGLRAYLTRPAPLNPNVAHFEVVMRATSQLSSASQQDFSMILRGKVRTWSPTDGWSAPVFTRNAAWWLADLWLNPIWGEGLPEELVDLQGLYDWSLTLDARQDHFDYAFTTTTDSWEAAQLIARSGRARVFRRRGVYTLARDEAVTFPVAAFTPRNTQPKSMVLHEATAQLETPDGIIAQYTNNVTWDQATIECPCPGFTVTDPSDPRYDSTLPMMSKPQYVTLDGITGATHAEREGLYQAASMALRRATVSTKVEMEGALVAFMDPVRWQPQIVGYGQSGDVAFWDVTTLTMGLSEPADFSGAAPYLTLQRDDGSLTTPVAVRPGPTAYDVILPAAPDFDLVLDDGTRERPKFILGPIDTGDELVKISSISDGGTTDGGAQLFQIEAVVDDPRVHTADAGLLPGPGDIQDPIDDGTTSSDVDFSVIVDLGKINMGPSKDQGTRVDGINPDWTIEITLPAGQTYQAWSPWPSNNDSNVPSPPNAWGNQLQISTDDGTTLSVGSNGISSTPEGARALFPNATVSGYSAYILWINDSDPYNNRGGLSVKLEKID